MKDDSYDVIVSLWGNSTLGLLTYWWSANKAQDGRGSITTTQIPKLYILDPRKLTTATLKNANDFYRLVKSKLLLPAHQLASPHYSWFLENRVKNEHRLLSAFNLIVKCFGVRASRENRVADLVIERGKNAFLKNTPALVCCDF